jgi:uncharacterized membrane protein
MDYLNAIRSGIFFVAGILTIIFQKQLNNLKNHLLEKNNIKRKNEKKSYLYTGTVFIIISIILLIYSILN